MDRSDTAFPLSAIETRVLGALMEKSVTTPEYYPMTLNSLLAACNQRTSREPVTDYDEAEVTAALDSLRAKGLARRVDMAGSRAPKFRQVIGEALELQAPGFALLTVLFLRGPQTLGQLRTRTERMHPFRDLEQVQEALNELAQREEEPHEVVQALPRRPGSKEIRFAQILGEEPIEEAVREDMEAEAPMARPKFGPSTHELTERIAALETALEDLRSQFSEFRRQFE